MAQVLPFLILWAWGFFRLLKGEEGEGALLPNSLGNLQIEVCLGGYKRQLLEVSNLLGLAHQNRTIAIASDFRVDRAKSPEIPQKEGVLDSDIAARNRKSLATFHRTLKSQCRIAFSCLGTRAISEGRDGHRKRKSQKSLRFRCAKLLGECSRTGGTPSRRSALQNPVRRIFL